MKSLPSMPSRSLRLILACTGCVAAVYFLVMLVIPKTEPRAYSLDAIASALGSGIAAGELDVQLAVPPPLSQDQHDRAIGLALADRLSVEPSAVRVVLRAPQSFIDARNSDSSGQGAVNDDIRETVRAMSEMPDHIVGDFTAAMRLNDEQWRVVRPAILVRVD